ncbi:MAG: aprX [Frankiales bacterium]|nr:aprX [Frankiales bacterium]
MPALAGVSPRATVAVLLAGALAAASSSSLAASSTSWSRAGTLDSGLSTAGHALQSVIVSGADGASALVERAVRAVGGTNEKALPIINGVSVDVPADRLAQLSRATGVTAVTRNRVVQLSGNSWDDSTSNSSYAWTAGAAPAWSSSGSGAGVSVAVLDTGVSLVNDLSGRVMSGPDLSGENKNTVDSYGHGTVMAGIIAGNGADSQPSPRTGIAPAAKIISVKVAGADGSTDVSTVLAGMSWIGAFKDTYNIKVLSLSWGVPSTQNPTIDPLNYGVEKLWQLGVTVVVAAGNNGSNAGTILKPGDDPLVVTVGAFDDHGDLNNTNDSVPAWSSRGPTPTGLAKPDVLAPGRTLVATRAPGSTVESQNPKALIAPSYIKGSGTSEATAATAGVAALVLAAHPSWTPDQVKYALTSTASPLGGVPVGTQGAGRVSASAALSANVASAPVQTMNADASGSLQASRGTGAQASVMCNGASKVLNDETTAWCSNWTGSAWTGTAWTGSAWTGTAWTGSAWTGSAWTGTAWTGTAWTGTAWTGTAWTGSAWTGTAWTGTAWTGSAWTGTAWTSAIYDDPDTTFMSAFWGAHPKFNKHLSGETSEDAPGHGLERS